MGTFCFILGEDPTYLNIYEGAWLNDEPYGVIHRMAASGKRKGVSEACLNWCFEHFENIRVDTHRDNKVMQHILTKYGFQRCGIIYVKNGQSALLTKALPFSRSLFIDKLLVQQIKHPYHGGVRWFPRRKRPFPLKGTPFLTGKRQFPLKEMIGNYKLLRTNYIEFYWLCCRVYVHVCTVLN